MEADASTFAIRRSVLFIKQIMVSLWVFQWDIKLSVNATNDYSHKMITNDFIQENNFNRIANWSSLKYKNIYFTKLSYD